MPSPGHDAHIRHPLNERNVGTLYGGVIRCYSVRQRHCLIGTRQVCFDRRKARLLATHPMNAFGTAEDPMNVFDFYDDA